jgi:TrmH family RNA methyltransferase
MTAIESRGNIKFKAWAALLDARGIKKAGQALISGGKLVEEFLRQNPSAAEDLIVPMNLEAPSLPAHIRVHHLATPLFKELDVLGTKAPLLVVRTPELDTWKGEAPRGLELIVALSDPGNLGALLRSAEAFGVTRVILTQEACSPFLPKAIRAASGATFRLPLASTGPLAGVRANPGFSLDMHGEDLAQFHWPRDLYLVLGEEGRGLPAELGLDRLSIPMQGRSESLNATTAAAIAMFSYASAHPR